MDLQRIFADVKAYQKALGYDFDVMSYEERIKIFRDHYVALSVEQTELINELPWKPWRPIEDQHIGTQGILLKEWTDCLFFLVDQALCLGLTGNEANEAFENVLATNLDRIKSGYNSVKDNSK